MTTLKIGLPELYSRHGKDYFLATTPATTPWDLQCLSFS
jgi:hypothetical protein